MSTERKEDVFAFVVNMSANVLAFGFIVPAVFLILNAFQIKLLPEYASDYVVQVLQHGWPVLTQQYDLLKSLRRTAQAENYAALHVFGVFSFTYLIIKGVSSYNNSSINTPTYKEAIMIVLGVSLYIALIFFKLDRAEYTVKSAYRLYYDIYGMYLFRQYMFFVLFQICALICLFSFLKLLIDLLHAKPVNLRSGRSDAER
jgi:hypothetical protein